MSELWREKASFKRLDEEWRTIADILPYERLYETLTQAQLQELLRDAKRLHWQTLDLHKCGLEALSPEMGDLADLRILDLGNGRWGDTDKFFQSAKENVFSELPDSFGNLSNLQSLWLNSTPITTLPNFIENLSKLQALDLRHTQITTFPSFINLSNLQKLDLRYTQIATLPDSIGQFSNLKALWLCDTQIATLPDSIANLSNLQSLDLRHTQITTLPNPVGQLFNLQELDLRYTKITNLSNFFGQLLNLRRLYLSKTQIATLPDFVGQLSDLQLLDLDNTPITTLPDSIANLSNLQELDLRGTPLYEKLPPEIREQLLFEPQKAIRYILEMQSTAPKRYFNETKMVVVGQGSVGKSCLINQLIHRRYENQHSTEGIDIELWDFIGKDARLDNQETYRLNVWDFGGQEIYHATHQFFLTHRTLYLLMWDALTEDEYGRRDYWMRTIRSFAGDSPVIIAVNKCDKNLGRYPQAEYAFLDKYPQILNRDRVFYISCRDNVGIDELRDYILYEAVKMPLMKTELLEKWLNVRKDLETLSEQENYIHYDEYLKICEKRGVRDEQEAQMLIQYLHDLGVITYYHDDELLCGIVILSPEWGTDAVYKVLDEQQRTLKGRNGILLYEDLPKIWSDGKRYPRRMYPYLLKLMEKFQLAFQVDNPKLPENTYLVAELLSENPMPHDWPSEGAEPLAFRYEYDFMPAGVMTRLIVSIHQYLEDIDGVKQCWRKGAYLVRGSAHAKLVLYDGIDRKYLDIRVIGENPRERSELLTVIREHVRGINSRFQKIEITEQAPCKCSAGCRHFFKYDTLLKAEAKRHLDVECPETLERVSVELLLDGIQKTVEDKRREAEYGGMNLSIDHMEGNIIVDSPIGKNAEIHGTHEAATPEPEHTEPTPTERAEIRNQNADTLLKILWVIITLLILLGAGYLLITHNMTVRELLEPFLGNLPG
ncbi:MAG: GTP-binding protein [Oscillibacter sp.]|nr:GTP-binding protein [Oscillibacter sp.]